MGSYLGEGDERHTKMVIDFFDMDESSKKLTKMVYFDDDVKDATDSQELDIQECKSLAARLNFIAQDNPAMQCSAMALKTTISRRLRSLQGCSWACKLSNGSTLGRKNRRL